MKTNNSSLNPIGQGFLRVPLMYQEYAQQTTSINGAVNSWDLLNKSKLREMQRFDCKMLNQKNDGLLDKCLTRESNE